MTDPELIAKKPTLIETCVRLGDLLEFSEALRAWIAAR